MGNRDVIVTQALVEKWMQKHQPMAPEKLAVASLVSVKTVMALINGKAPKLPRTRFQLARAMGIPVENLFQPVKKIG